MNRIIFFSYSESTINLGGTYRREAGISKGEMGQEKVHSGPQDGLALVAIMSPLAIIVKIQFSSVQLLSCVQLLAAPWIAAR